MVPDEFFGRLAQFAGEGADEVGIGLEPYGFAHFFYFSPFFQQGTGHLEPVHSQIAADGEPGMFPEHLAQPGLAYIQVGGQVFQGNLFPVVAVDVLEDLLDQAVVFSGTGLSGRSSCLQDPGNDQDEVEQEQILLDVLAIGIRSRLKQGLHQTADLGQFLVGQLDGLWGGLEQGFQIRLLRGQPFQDGKGKPDGIPAGGFVGTAETVVDFKGVDQEQAAYIQRILLFLEKKITDIVQTDVNFQLVMKMGTGIHIMVSPIGIIETVCHNELPFSVMDSFFMIRQMEGFVNQRKSC